MKPNQTPAPRFVSIPEFVERSSLSRATVYNLIKSGDLPKPTRLTPNRVAWPAPVIEAFFASRVKAA